MSEPRTQDNLRRAYEDQDIPTGRDRGVAVFESYVAMGDSFTEGLDDPRPDGTHRGWADLVAVRLEQEHPGLLYANLAVRGRKLAGVMDEQLPRVEEMRPSLITMAAGGNDLIRMNGDVPALAHSVHVILERLVATGATVVVFAGFDPRERIPFSRVPGERGERLNVLIRQSAADLGAVLVDLWVMPRLYEPRMWAPDRLHLSGDGHALVAAEVLSTLGYACEFGDFVDDPVDSGRDPKWPAARIEDVRWAATYFIPWLYRGLRGRSSGDGVEPKFPDLVPVDPAIGR
jgi:lysophospholipase L1-like esterase